LSLFFHARSGAVFAIQAHCPHRGGPLADGLTDATSVVCPLHDRIYDLRSGDGIGNDCILLTYPVRIGADGQVLIVPVPRQAMAAG
jgi:nitrite reductase (NADH) small subunit